MRGHKSSILGGYTLNTKATLSLYETNSFPRYFSFSFFQLTLAPKETSHEFLYLIRGGLWEMDI